MVSRLEDHDSGGREATGLEASRSISARLSVAARKLRFSTSSRSGLYQAVGLRPRLIDRAFSAATIFFTLIYVILPISMAVGYYGFLASDQFQSESRFTVRSSTPALGKDQVAKVTGIPAAKIAQDTQIVVNFIKSHEMIDVLKKRIDLKTVFGDPSIDWWARLPDDASAEELLEYWEGMVTTSISPTSGIVTVKVRAFRPEDAAMLVTEILKASEVVVNQVNDRIWKDVTRTAEENLENAKIQLQKARDTFAKSRNDSGVLTIEASSQIISNLLNTAETERLKLQQRYDSQIAVVSKDAPQMRILRREIESKDQQIAELNSRLAGQSASSPNLADVSQDFSQLQLAQSLAEQQFASSVKTVEQVQFVSRQQLLYLDSFMAPRVPDDAEYPRRALWIAVTFAVSLLMWSSAMGLLHLARNQLSH